MQINIGMRNTIKETNNVNDVLNTTKHNSTPKWQTMSRLLESLKFWTHQEVVHLASNIAAQTRHPEPHEQNITLGVPKPTPQTNAHSSSHTRKLRSGNTDNGTRAQIDNNQNLRHDTPQNIVNANATAIATPRQLEIRNHNPLAIGHQHALKHNQQRRQSPNKSFQRLWASAGDIDS